MFFECKLVSIETEKTKKDNPKLPKHCKNTCFPSPQVVFCFSGFQLKTILHVKTQRFFCIRDCMFLFFFVVFFVFPPAQPLPPVAAGGGGGPMS